MTALDPIFRFVQQTVRQLLYQSDMGQQQLVEIYTTHSFYAREFISHARRRQPKVPYLVEGNEFIFQSDPDPSVAWLIIDWKRCPVAASMTSPDTIWEPPKDDAVDQFIFDLTHHRRQMRRCYRGPMQIEDWLETKE